MKGCFRWNLPLDTVGSGDYEHMGHNGAAAVKLLSKLDAHGPGVRASTSLLPIHNPRVSLGGAAH